jgi:two-component system NarL family sensor kinase
MNLSTLINRYSHLRGIESFKEPIEQLDNATRELRRTAHNLMPAILLKEGLVDAVYFFCKNLEQSISLSIHVQSFGTIPQLPKEAELSIYRIIQELVHNIVKHAKASRALIELSGQNNLLLISVEDDGIGLPEQVIGQHETGVGLSTIRNRVAALNGTIAIQSSAGKGTVFNIEFDITHLLNSEKKN